MSDIRADSAGNRTGVDNPSAARQAGMICRFQPT